MEGACVVEIDNEVDIVYVKTRDGEIKRVLSGVGRFYIFADENGAFAVEIHVQKWEGDKKS